MGSLNLVVLIFLLVLLPIAAKGDDFPNPFIGNNYTCEEVQCGRGSCEASRNYPFGFRCDCEDGWRRTRLDDHDEDHLEFLPCIIPNCSVDYSCMPAAPPAPVPLPHNVSFYEPCNWIYCGEGTCTRNRTHTHTCQCSPGYSNLLNISAFPCYNDCAIGSDSCERLGIRSATSTSNPSNSDNSNKAITLSLGKFNWMVVLLISLPTIAGTGNRNF
ncbi:hypothetical protein ACJIZ3_015954 [Penstemon smallii]|uniref:EGF-like domain-containing protein n=1 Tax=Penstemon smallii TaxID=265156 RepID=A0ABD3RRU1_9LAMI